MKSAKLSSDYGRYGLKETNIPEVWEDGMRTDGKKGTFEWWYFDTHLEDGSIVVASYMAKNAMKIDNADVLPYISLVITRPDGSTIKREIEYTEKEFSASKERCDVVIGKNYFRGNLKEYQIHFEDHELNVDIKVTRTTESWRPKTGFCVFGEQEESYFAWVVAVPQGEAEVNYTYLNDEKYTGKGSCYHDHNWGNISIVKIFNHWYWSRAQLGPYTIIAAEMITEKEYNNESLMSFNLSNDGKTVADDNNSLKLYRSFGKMHPEYHKDISDHLVFIYESESNEYRYEYFLHKERIIDDADLLKTSVTGLKYALVKLFTSFDGHYLRFSGKTELRVYKGKEMVENYTSDVAVWELMYLGEPNK